MIIGSYSTFKVKIARHGNDNSQNIMLKLYNNDNNNSCNGNINNITNNSNNKIQNSGPEQLNYFT